MLLKIKKVIFTLHVALVETGEHLTCINIVLKRRIVVKDPIKCLITGDKMITADTDAADSPKGFLQEYQPDSFWRSAGPCIPAQSDVHPEP